MNRVQWIQKIELLNKLVEMGDISPEIRTDVIENLIDDEWKEWDAGTMEQAGIIVTKEDDR
jgi:hypothetical protein